MLKHKKKPIPRHNAIAEPVTLKEIPQSTFNINQITSNQLTNTQNNNNNSITPPNQQQPQEYPNISADKFNVNIKNEIQIYKPKISYHEVFLMAKHFSNWRFAFVKLQKAFDLETVEIRETLSEMLIRDEDFSSSPPSRSGNNSSLNSSNPPSPSGNNTSLNSSLNELVNSSDSELEDLNSTTVKTNSLLNKISEEIKAINTKIINSPDKISKDNTTNNSIAFHSESIIKDTLKASSITSKKDEEKKSQFRSSEGIDSNRINNNSLSFTGAIPKSNIQNKFPDTKIMLDPTNFQFLLKLLIATPINQFLKTNHLLHKPDQNLTSNTKLKI